jgi:hypothetical protein
MSPEEELTRLGMRVRVAPPRNGRKGARDKRSTIAMAKPLPVSDFIAYSPDHTYIHRPTLEEWTFSTVNARVMPMKIGIGKKALAANVWLDRNDAVEQRVWAPGEPQIVENRLVAEGGFFAKQGARVLNVYKPPHIIALASCDVLFLARPTACALAR